MLSVGRSKFFGIDEQGFMALFLVIAVIQVACALSAVSYVVPGDAGTASVAPAHDGTMLAKR